jgi:hypothetical protein
MEERKSGIWFRSPTFCDNSPVGAEAKRKIAVSVENRPTKLPLLNKITDNKEKEGFMGCDSACRVVLKVTQYAEPSVPIWRF